MNRLEQIFSDEFPQFLKKPKQKFTFGTAGYRTKAENLVSCVCRSSLIVALLSQRNRKPTGLMLSASHNVKTDNGIKLINSHGELLSENEEKLCDQLVNCEDSEFLLVFKEVSAKLGVDFTGQNEKESEAVFLQDALVMLGRDTRESGEYLEYQIIKTLDLFKVKSITYGFVSTPQLHFLVRNSTECRNIFMKSFYYDWLSNEYSNLVKLLKNKESKVFIDTANGVGGLIINHLAKRLTQKKMQIINIGLNSLENESDTNHKSDSSSSSFKNHHYRLDLSSTSSSFESKKDISNYSYNKSTGLEASNFEEKHVIYEKFSRTHDKENDLEEKAKSQNLFLQKSKSAESEKFSKISDDLQVELPNYKNKSNFAIRTENEGPFYGGNNDEEVSKISKRGQFDISQDYKKIQTEKNTKTNGISDDFVPNPQFLNEKCGADYIVTNKKIPSNICVSPSKISRAVSFDGDADRLIYFGSRPQFCLIDGDRIAVFLANLIGSMAIKIANLEIGVVLSHYSNSAAIKQIKPFIKTCLAQTGVKFFVEKAKMFDIGIYFEPNGHGSVIFSSKAIEELEKLANSTKDNRNKNKEMQIRKFVFEGCVDLSDSNISKDKFKDILKTLFSKGLEKEDKVITKKEVDSISEDSIATAQILLGLSRIFDPSTGDAIANFLAIEALTKNETFLQDFITYKNLPTRMLSVEIKDKSMIKTTRDIEILHPIELRTKIEQLSKVHKGRVFVRPSGTENIVRVFSEGITSEECDSLCVRVAQAVYDICDGVGKHPEIEY